MKLYKLAIMLLLFIITNAYADATVKPSNVNNKTHNNINIEQDCSNRVCGTRLNFKTNVRSLRVSKGRYSWIKRKIIFKILKNRRYHPGYILLSSNCNIGYGTVNLANDIWRAGQYKYFSNSYTGRRLACRVQKIYIS